MNELFNSKNIIMDTKKYNYPFGSGIMNIKIIIKSKMGGNTI
jgi:hypothetical protein